MEALQAIQEPILDAHNPEINREQIIKYMNAFGLASELTEQAKLQFIEF